MRKIQVSEITDGMVLAKPLLGPGGNILLGQGVELRSAITPRLMSYGINFLFIEGDKEFPDEIAPSSEFIEKRMLYIFDKEIENPFMKIIFEEVFKFRSTRNDP